MQRGKKNEDDTNRILKYLDEYGVVDKDRIVDSHRSERKSIIKSSKKTLRLTLDLHGMTESEATRKIRATFDGIGNRGIKEILIIHGKGYHSAPDQGPVLKKLVRSMLENELCGCVRNFSAAPVRDGGDGATLVFLR